MSLLQIAGVGFLAAMALLLLRELRPSFAPPLRLGACVLLLGAGLSLLSPIVAKINALLQMGNAEGLGGVLLRALGIAMLSELTASFCEDLGEPTIARCISTFGKWEILVLCLPLLDKVLELAKELLQY